MPSRRQAALWAQCWAVVGSHPFLVETQAPASRQRSLSAQESAVTCAVGAESAGDTGAGAERCSAFEQPAPDRPSTDAHTKPNQDEMAPARGSSRALCSMLGIETRRRASTCDLCFGRATLIRDDAQLAVELLGAVTSARRLVPRFVSTTVRGHSQSEVIDRRRLRRRYRRARSDAMKHRSGPCKTACTARALHVSRAMLRVVHATSRGRDSRERTSALGETTSRRHARSRLIERRLRDSHARHSLHTRTSPPEPCRVCWQPERSRRSERHVMGGDCRGRQQRSALAFVRLAALVECCTCS
ncbi:MAG: hypothetical protein K0R38_5472 [Polyangiaceae bacterium]|jgi:hypothetical protein|nr:hypothetical protein [Polyangiaceae bacterium]